MKTELAKNYDPPAVELAASSVWTEENLFHAEPTDPGEPYSIVIPPPNVTGALHLGHAINNTLQDILIRVHRMRGFNTVWIPGIDHAGIATQAVVEKQLKEKENKTRHDVGREGLVERIWEWKQQFGDRIVAQLKRLGCSCDWERQRFTLDEQCARAVRETFFKLFKDGLVYRGKRLVNWDTHLQTSISDDEIYHETVKTSLWTIKYEIVGRESEVVGRNNSKTSDLRPTTPDPRPTFVTIATTRPETLLGDTAVAVHSQDPRWNWAIGKSVQLPLTKRLIPIIADDILVDPKFGTGVVKVTPAHDPNDYAVYQRHLGQPDEIGIINLMNPDGTLNENAGERYKGLSMSAARKKVVEDLGDLLVKEEPYETQVGHSDRSKTPIQPYLSDQWFVKMAPLAEPALKVVEDGTIQFFPERHKQQYLSWLGEKRDWPISRQLWWGHRIPIWSKPTNKRGPIPGTQKPATAEERAAITAENASDPDWQDHHLKVRQWRDAGRLVFIQHFQDNADDDDYPIDEFYCVRNESDREVIDAIEKRGWKQDPDVLDTWFSSALWPHSTLGWPELTADLAKWYPTRVLLTGRDIITLWVARMVMTGMYNMGGNAECRLPNAESKAEANARGDSANSHSAFGVRHSTFNGIPFFHVAINPTILDGKGERMSKSKGNGVDPVDIIETHGADALRFTLTQMATETQDVRLPVKKDAQGRNTSDKFDVGRNFCNKLWNASRFVLSSIEGKVPSAECRVPSLRLADRWIVSRFASTLNDANHALATYRFDQYAKVCYDFVWRDLCDWYVEAVKPAMKDAQRSAQAGQVLASMLDAALRLLHPIIPFITETIWWRLNEVCPQRGLAGVLECPPSTRLIKAAWPTTVKSDPDADRIFENLQGIIIAIRNVRSEHKVDPKKPVTVSIAPAGADVRVIEENRELMELLAGCTVKTVRDKLPAITGAIDLIVNGDTHLYVEGLVDEQAEAQRKTKRVDELSKQIAAMKGRLSNEGYIAKAPAKLVDDTKKQLADAEAELKKLKGD